MAVQLGVSKSSYATATKGQEKKFGDLTCRGFWTNGGRLEKALSIDYTLDTMRTQKFETVVRKGGKHYAAQCLNVDISSFGKDKKEALKNLEEALGLYFEDAQPKTISRIERPVIVRRQLQHA